MARGLLDVVVMAKDPSEKRERADEQEPADPKATVANENKRDEDDDEDKEVDVDDDDVEEIDLDDLDAMEGPDA